VLTAEEGPVAFVERDRHGKVLTVWVRIGTSAAFGALSPSPWAGFVR
jgi:hypothetical protein